MNKFLIYNIFFIFVFSAGLASAGIKQFKDTGDGFNDESENVQAHLSQVIGEAYSLKEKIKTSIVDLRRVKADKIDELKKSGVPVQALIDYSVDLEKLITLLSSKATDLLAVQDQIVALKQKIVLKELSMDMKEKQNKDPKGIALDLEEHKILVASLQKDKEQLLQKMSVIYREKEEVLQQLEVSKNQNGQENSSSSNQMTKQEEQWQQEVLRLQKTLEQKDARMNQLENALKILKNDNNQITVQLQELNKERIVLTEESEKYKENFTDSVSEEEKLIVEKTKLEERIAQLTDKIEAVELLLLQKEQEAKLVLQSQKELNEQLKYKDLLMRELKEEKDSLQETYTQEIIAVKKPLEDKIELLKKEVQRILGNADQEMSEATNRLEQQYQDIQKEMQIKEETYAKALREVQGPLQERIMGLERELENSRDLLSKKDEQLVVSEKDYENILSELSQVREQNQDFMQELSSLEEKLRITQEELGGKSSSFVAAQDELENLRNSVVFLEKVNADLKADKELSLKNIEELKVQTHDEITGIKQSLEERIATLNETLNERNIAIEQERANSGTILNENQKLQSELVALEEVNKGLVARIMISENQLAKQDTAISQNEDQASSSLQNLLQIREEISKALSFISASSK